ncbi:hypothetical protein [Variovorax atrisoli]|uniref:hypothetical protein n=1 Tax=Variovorax TaxID=34072 RepID=UPI0025FD35F0|nr:hypothetical protein [uncultured Variovorax sp.]
MEAQELLIALHDESAGYEIAPDRMPLSILRNFAKDVDDFLRGDGNDIDTSALDVSIEKGSFAIRTAPIANPILLNDLRKLANSQEMDDIGPKRRAVIERWQKNARGGRRWRVSIGASFLPAAIVISAESDFHADDADQWVRVERYVRGEIEDMGGQSKPNAHIRLPDGKTLLVDAAREMLRDEKVNRLYKPAMVRIVAEYNVRTREYRGARLLEFVEHESRFDEKDLARLTQRGAKAWRDTPDAGAWIDDLRGGKE